MKQQRLVTLFLLFLVFTACAPMRRPIPAGTVPAARPVSTDEEQYGHTVLSGLSEKYPLDYENPRLNDVTAIVDRLAKAAGADHDPWHVFLLRAPEIKNAAATRGNHVFVWTGLLNYTQSDDELAAIISHEMAHVLAGHTDPDPNEELRTMMINIGAAAAGIAVSAATRNASISANLGDITSSLTQQVGAGALIYPYSRDLELEADQIGLLIMASAKFDPRRAIEFWQRAKDDPDFSSSFEFFSTHPPAEARLKNLESALPLALARYEGREQVVAPSTENRSVLRQFAREENSLQSQAHQGHSWRVVSSKAILYSEPNKLGHRLGELRRGAVVSTIGRRRGWLEIDSPEHGFLEGKDLEPVS